MRKCACGCENPEFFEEVATDQETMEIVRARGIRCPVCGRATYIFKDLNVDFDKKEADEHLAESWDKTMLKELLSKENILEKKETRH